jgi:hypothetical protein
MTKMCKTCVRVLRGQIDVNLFVIILICIAFFSSDVLELSAFKSNTLRYNYLKYLNKMS